MLWRQWDGHPLLHLALLLFVKELSQRADRLAAQAAVAALTVAQGLQSRLVRLFGYERSQTRGGEVPAPVPGRRPAGELLAWTVDRAGSGRPCGPTAPCCLLPACSRTGLFPAGLRSGSALHSGPTLLCLQFAAHFHKLVPELER